uniref:C2H2-type domain-containing protein n=1 Tax=Parascaris univalens TaxID=6257 RepID=A0A915A0Y1_PARUN
VMPSSFQASESNSPDIFLLAHVPTLKEMIFTHDVHEILARKNLDGRSANEELAAPSNSSISPANELLAAFSTRAMQLQSSDDKTSAEDRFSSITPGQLSGPSDVADYSFFHIPAKADGTTGAQLTQLGDTMGKCTEKGLDPLQLHYLASAEMQQQRKDVSNKSSKHLRAAVTQFLCNACGGSYKSRRHLYFHKRQVHIIFTFPFYVSWEPGEYM